MQPEAESAGVDGAPIADLVPTNPGSDAGNAMPEPALRIAEALLFASSEPVPLSHLQNALPNGVSAREVLAALGERYAGRGVIPVAIAGGYAFRTAPDLAAELTRIVEVPRRLSRVAIETLAIIAWHQPCTRADVEDIRGSALSQNTLDALLDMGLIAPKGRREAPGRPTLWGTTPAFLSQFGLASLADLPRREDLLPGAGSLLPKPQ
ncbi:SMC-Scp complex subunit ScpB [Humitalea sp. 24SJ18S-53]|uniref:SMC-Scp complex subunit ScpB n=1 Tax=Humitalea sp. 24SJ18S-53 TaxID=3422307 RepID=UPI003D675F87